MQSEILFVIIWITSCPKCGLWCSYVFPVFTGITSQSKLAVAKCLVKVYNKIAQILRNVQSDPIDDGMSDSEAEALVNATVACVMVRESQLPEFSDGEVDSQSQPAQYILWCKEQ